MSTRFASLSSVTQVTRFSIDDITEFIKAGTHSVQCKRGPWALAVMARYFLPLLDVNVGLGHYFLSVSLSAA